MRWSTCSPREPRAWIGHFARWPGGAARPFGVDKPKNADHQVIVTGYKATRHRKLTLGQKQANRIPAAAGRTPVGHGFAHLKAWRVLTKLRTDPARAATLLRALFVLTNLARRSPLTDDLHPRHPRHPPNTSMTTPNAPHATLP
ncbi:hypothetical protein ACFXJ6_03000 [Streptomyces sp. NPDC059218]|uniref:hypothetical protein n=1 Tax=unclassified Streptomyces TaxID=2593676 RepID=UPI00367B9BEC